MNTIQKQPHGYENSSKLDSSRTVLSMKDQLPKSLQGTCQHIRNVISSLALVDGVTHCSLPDGRQISQFGQVPAHVSPSAQQAKDSPKQTSDTSGPCSSISSRSADLSMSLASRLQAQLGKDGLMEYRQTWNQKVTPAGRQYWAHTASAHRILDKDSTGLQTQEDGKESCSPPNATKMETALNVELTLQTADVSDQLKTDLNTRSSMASSMAGWPTASSRDWKDSPGMATTGVNPDGSIRTRLDQLPRVAQLVGWCSPTVTDANRGVLPPRPQDTGIPLTQQVSGLTSNSSPAETGKAAGFQLNPHFSRWLMGFPPEWCACAVMAMQSFPKSRRSSSKPT